MTDEQSRDGLLADARALFDLVRPLWHYAPRGTPDGARFEQSEQGRFLMRSMEKIAALSRPSLEPTLGSHTDCIGAMPTARSGVLRTEPVPVSSLRAPATIAKGEK